MLCQGNYEVKTVSLIRDSIPSIGGFHVIPDYDVQYAPIDYEALILIGGMTWRNENAGQVKPLAEHTSNDLQDLNVDPAFYFA